ncbi:MAG: flagellar biosynthesis anti-sigma factor FlgM [Bacteroidales bacterium]|nr:flagellar biosynthesis anti-sigma factor FlgM [Candidatus Latescibacterota bacterium]
MKINNIRQGKVNDPSASRDAEKNRESAARTGPGQGTGSSTKEASEVSETSRLVSRARIEAEKTGDVRADRVAEVKQRLADGYYDSDEVRESIASRLAAHLKQIMDR